MEKFFLVIFFIFHSHLVVSEKYSLQQDNNESADKLSQKIIRSLSLTEEQGTRVIALNRKTALQLKEIINSADSAKIEYKVKLKKLSEDNDKEMKSILTDSQYQQYLLLMNKNKP